MSRVEFGADGIRYIAGRSPLDRDGGARIGRAIGRYLVRRGSQPTAIIGRDTRSSGCWLTEVITEGLLAEGVNVVDAGVTTTPSIAYLARDQTADMGIAVSASHNPAEYNGVKLIGPSGLRLQREDEIEIEGLISDSARQPTPSERTRGERANGAHLRELYIQHHVQHAPASSLAGLGVVLDCANGAACHIAPETFRRPGADVTVINAAPDGHNINRLSGSEHVRHHPADLVQAVRAQGASYGFAFDGDGDRLVVVDAAGEVYNGDDLLFAFALYYRARGLLRHDTVVTTQMVNRGLDCALGRFGIRMVRAGKGDKAVEAAMWSGGFTLGGEQVGNIIINDGHHTAADAVYAALVLASDLQGQRTSLSGVVRSLDKWPQILASLCVEPSLRTESVLAIEEAARRLLVELGTNWRILTWRSTTEPGTIRVMVEAGPTQAFEEVEQVAASICQSVLAISGRAHCSMLTEALSNRRIQ